MFRVRVPSSGGPAPRPRLPSIGRVTALLNYSRPKSDLCSNVKFFHFYKLAKKLIKLIGSNIVAKGNTNTTPTCFVALFELFMNGFKTGGGSVECGCQLVVRPENILTLTQDLWLVTRAPQLSLIWGLLIKLNSQPFDSKLCGVKGKTVLITIK